MCRRLSFVTRFPATVGVAGALVAGLTAGLIAGLIAGCAASGTTTAKAAAACGHTLTAVNIAVMIKIGRGPVTCPTAMTVENSYAAMVRSGELRGNGGGAPVSVHGWTCQGYTSAEIAQNDRVSVCAKGDEEIFAWLPARATSA
jgi:hypothetical protein